MIKYVLYDGNNKVYSVLDTKEDAISDCRFYNALRKMAHNEKEIQIGTIECTEEELEEFIKNI